MKTLREYIDLIKEAEKQDWKAVIANEVKARGLPNYFYYYAEYTHELPFRISYDEDKELYAWFEDYGVGTWRVDEESDEYSDANSLIQSIQSTLALGEGDSPVGEFDGKERDKGGSDGSTFDITGGWTPERDGSDELSDLESEYGAENIYDLFQMSQSDNAPRITSMEPEWGDDQYVNVLFSSNLKVVWDDLQIELHGPTPKIADVTGELTVVSPAKPTAKPVAPVKPAASVKPVAPNPAVPPQDDQTA
jgi:hypothetical protein